METKRICISCRRPFRSLSKSNRICKSCRKKQRSLSGSLTNLDTAYMPQILRSKIQSEYFEHKKPVLVISRLEEERKAFLARQQVSLSFTFDDCTFVACL